MQFRGEWCLKDSPDFDIMVARGSGRPCNASDKASATSKRPESLPEGGFATILLTDLSSCLKYSMARFIEAIA